LLLGHPQPARADPGPISSDEDIIRYLNHTGLLNDLGLSPGEALTRLQSIDVSRHQLHPAALSIVAASEPPPQPAYLAGEFMETEAIVITWPTSYPRHWSAGAQMVKHIVSAGACVYILVDNVFWQKAAELYLAQDTAHSAALDLTRVKFLHIETNRIWARDYAPFSIRSTRGTVFVQGNVIPNVAWPQSSDASVGLDIAGYFSQPFHRLPLILEGGNLITDGHGTCLMLDTILYWNPQLSVATVKQLLTEYLGCTRVILLPALPGERTGHIDMIAMYLNETTLLVAQSEPAQQWYETLEAIAAYLSQTPSGSGQNYQIERVKLANPNHTSVPFWSYTNSLIVNDTVIVPAFGEEHHDREALETFRHLMPEYRIVSVSFGVMPVGAVHCSTMQIVVDASNTPSDKMRPWLFMQTTPSDNLHRVDTAQSFALNNSLLQAEVLLSRHLPQKLCGRVVCIHVPAK